MGCIPRFRLERPPVGDVVIGRGCRRCYLGILRGGTRGNHTNDEVSDVHTIVLSNDRGLGDAPSIDVRSVRAVEVSNDEPSFPIQDAGVPFGNIPPWQNQIIALHPPQSDLVTVESLTTFSSSLLGDEKRELVSICSGIRGHVRLQISQ